MSDVSQQQRYRVSDIDSDATVSEFLSQVKGLLGLPSHDSTGQPIRYTPLHERMGRHLRTDEKLGGVLEDDDRLTLHPDIDAG